MGVEHILDADGNSEQREEVLTLAYPILKLAGLSQTLFRIQVAPRLDFGIDTGNPVQARRPPTR